MLIEETELFDIAPGNIGPVQKAAAQAAVALIGEVAVEVGQEHIPDVCAGILEAAAAALASVLSPGQAASILLGLAVSTYLAAEREGSTMN
jgi:hypothetical protein